MKRIITGALLVALLSGGATTCGGSDDNLLPLLLLAGLGGPGVTPDDYSGSAGDTPATEPVTLDPPADPAPGDTSSGGGGSGVVVGGDEDSGGGWGEETPPGDDGQSGSDTDQVADNGSGSGSGSADSGSGSGSADSGSGSGSGDSDSGSGNTGGNGNGNGNAGGNGNGNAGGNGNGNSDDENASGDDCSKRTVQLHPEGGKWYTDGNSGDRLLHTYWQDQELVAKVLHQCNSGWVRLHVKARNIHGPLPSFYTSFIVLVKDRHSDRVLGSMLIKASDSEWNTGSVLVQLEEGNPELNLVWTNDAYLEGVYDANIQIGDVWVEDADGVSAASSLDRSGSEMCYTNGRFFLDDEGALYTYWQNQAAGFCFANLPAGQYRVTVEARNHGELKLPRGYDAFQLLLAADGVTAALNVEAADNKYKSGSTTIDLTGGNQLLLVTWLNDSFKEGDYDANVKIRSIKLERIGESHRSALAGYLRKSGNGGVFALAATVLISALGLAGIYAYRRLRPNA